MSTAIRAAIMLTVLVIAPVVWVQRGPLPPRAQQFVERGVAAARRAFGVAPLAADPQEPASSPPPWPPASAGLRRPTVPKASVDEDAHGAAADASAAASVGPSTEVVDGADPLAASVEPLLTELRNLGVVQYELEHWGSSGKLFRFHCSMPLAESADHTRLFESVASDPVSSVRQVVADVASWRSSRTSRAAMR